MYDVLIRRARLPDMGGGSWEIAIAGGRIQAIGPQVGRGHLELDAADHLVTRGFVDTHLHLDKSRITGRYGKRITSLDVAIRETARIKREFTQSDIYTRAEATLLECISHGTTAVRTQVEVDAAVGLRGFRAIAQLARDYAHAVDVQICVFAQEGLTDSPEGDRLLRQAMAEGADLIGGAPYADRNPSGQLDRVFEIARRFDAEIDLHLDLAETPDGMLLAEVCRRTVAAGMQGRVAVGHVTQLAVVSPARHDELCALVADAGVAVTVLPSTDLFLMGRSASTAKPRGVLALNQLLERGVKCSVATNNVLNAFTLMGTVPCCAWPTCTPT